MSLRFLLVAGFITLLTACNATNNATPANAVSSAKSALSDLFYRQLMAAAGAGKITDRSNNSGLNIGDANPYNNGSLKQRYKAMAMCLSWDLETTSNTKTEENSATKTTTKTTSFKAFIKPKAIEAGNSSNWSTAGTAALRGCEARKLQNDLECKCQLVDRDNTNVLEIPNDVWQTIKQQSSTN